ncbi:MAG: TerC family protein [Desulfobacterales bacterium]|nr:TerC family protein [Desulfobacterales bacterium]
MMEQMISEISHLITPAGFFALVNVILIDIVMSGDNAIVIGLAVKDLKGKKRKQTIVLGIMMATIMRIMFASIAVLLLKTIGLKFAGGLLLLYVVWKFYKELRTQNEQECEGHQMKQATSMAGAIWLIMVADFSMSLDNVLAVAGAAKESLLILGIGLVFSIALMALASNFIAGKMEKYPLIQWVGLLIILFVAIEMLLTGGKELDERLLHVNILPAASIILGSLGYFLHYKYVQPAEDEKIAAWFAANWRGIFIANVLLLLSLCFFGDKVKNFMLHHPPALYFILAIVMFTIIEIIATFRAGRKSKNNCGK